MTHKKPFHPPLIRLAAFFMLAFAALGIVTGTWSVVARDELITRNDNPRALIAERRIMRGVIYDRSGYVLAITSGLPGEYIRAYPLPAAAPVVGYASLTYGFAGIEAAANDILRGEAGRDAADLWHDHALLGLPQIGRSVRLTLDAALQARAAQALGNRAGAVVAIHPASGDILALVSSPTYDPATLDEDWESLAEDDRAPLLNRATLGLYNTGDAFTPLVQAAILKFSHPNNRQVTTTLADLGLLATADLPLETRAIAPETLSNALNSDPPSPQITPLGMAWAAATLANGGTRLPLRLMAATEMVDGNWVDMPVEGHPLASLSPSVAAAMHDWLLDNGAAPAGAIGYAATAEGQHQTLGWWLGYTEDRQIALVVLLEDSTATDALAVAETILNPGSE